MHNTGLVNSSLTAGADAYLVKPINAEQCLATLIFLGHGRTRLNREVRMTPQRMLPSDSSEVSWLLSPREGQVLKGLADGLLYKEISVKLGISYSAVHKYQHNLFQKLQVTNRSEAIRCWFINNGGKMNELHVEGVTGCISRAAGSGFHRKRG
jgi:DNA-binding NarL/FixJ family response regulator